MTSPTQRGFFKRHSTDVTTEGDQSVETVLGMTSGQTLRLFKKFSKRESAHWSIQMLF